MLTIRNGRLARHLFASLGLAALAGCGDGILSAVPDPDPVGFLRGQLDGVAIESTAGALLSDPGPTDTRTLFLFATRPSGPATELHLRIQVVYVGPGVYALDSTQVEETEVMGGDIRIGSRVGSRPAPGELVITEFDEATNTIRGTVRFSLSRWTAASGWQTPSEFTGGTFEMLVHYPTPQ